QERHVRKEPLLPAFRFASLAVPRLSLATSPDPRRGKERRCSRRSRAETREAEARSCFAAAAKSSAGLRLRPSVQPPAGPADCGGSYRGTEAKASFVKRLPRVASP